MSLLSDLNDKIKRLSTRLGTEVKSLWSGVNTAQTTANTAKSTADEIAAIAVKTDSTAQRIAGIKSFYGMLIRQIANVTIGTNPTSTQYSAIHWSDSTNGTGAANRLATIEYSVDTSGKAQMLIGPYQYIAGKTAYTGQLLTLSIAADGTKAASVTNLTVSGYLAIPGGRIWIA